jgi:hypothetical protein
MMVGTIVCPPRLMVNTKAHYAPAPAGSGQDEGSAARGQASPAPRLPGADLKTAIIKQPPSQAEEIGIPADIGLVIELRVIGCREEVRVPRVAAETDSWGDPISKSCQPDQGQAR